MRCHPMLTALMCGAACSTAAVRTASTPRRAMLCHVSLLGLSACSSFVPPSHAATPSEQLKADELLLQDLLAEEQGLRKSIRMTLRYEKLEIQKFKQEKAASTNRLAIATEATSTPFERLARRLAFDPEPARIGTFDDLVRIRPRADPSE
uniref:Uncharacterized protein n=1 Tax=Prymnesium polylepis TaxID=72548 RepID=A0A7S4IT37_9EUKA|mmetsp:Transcript_34679/g.87149  ORF Transcript_34679/g.87149 Transcript_34679/m.87149 type:complete len:150 (+) Transcript_34679:92-541(+)